MLSRSYPRPPQSSARRSALAWAGAATLGFLIYLVGGGRELPRAWHLYLVALAAIAVLTLAGVALSGHRPESAPTVLAWLWARRRRPQRNRLRSLEELERAAGFSLATAFDVHFRLRPHLVEIARHRLAVRGVSLQTQPESARSLLGDRLWDLVRPDRQSPMSRNAKGIGIADLRDLVERLEWI